MVKASITHENKVSAEISKNDSIGPSWGHLGPSWGRLGAVLGHLGAKTILSPFWGHFGAHFGGQNWLKNHIFGGRFWDHFLDHFLTILGAILGTILGPDRPKKGARRAQEGHQEPQRPEKIHFQKPSKTFSFFRFLGSRGLPREPEEAQDGSQEAPKELQSLNKKGSKNGPQNYQFFD